MLSRSTVTSINFFNTFQVKKPSSVVSPSHKVPDSPKMVSHKHSMASQGDQKCKLKLNHLRRPSQATSVESKRSGNNATQSEMNLGKPQGLEAQAAGDSHGREASSHVKQNNDDKSQCGTTMKSSHVKQHNVEDKSPCGTAMKWEEYFEVLCLCTTILFHFI